MVDDEVDFDASGDPRDEMRRRLHEAMTFQGREAIEPLRTAIEAAREIGMGNDELKLALTLLQQLEAEAAPATFTDLPRDKMEELQACSSRGAALAILMPCLRLRLEDGFQSEILAEFHYQNFMFCQRKGFCVEKASTLISTLKAVHTRAIVQERASEQRARTLFTALMDKHSRQLPPYSIGVFTPDDVASIKEYVDTSFFRHYAMYAFVAHQRQDLVVEITAEKIEEPISPAAHLGPRRMDADATNRLAATSVRGSTPDILAAAVQPPAPLAGTEADVHKAVEDLLETHMQGALGSRLQQPSL